MPDRSPLPPQPRGVAAPTPPESLVVCPECGAAVAPRLFESHLRRAHQVYQFRGERRSLGDTLDALLGNLLAPRPDADAWHTLAEIAQDLQGEWAPAFLTTLLAQGLARVDGERRAGVVEGLAPLVAGEGSTPLLVTLASDNELAARHLALLAIARLPPPIDPHLVQPLRALLLDRRLPPEAQQEALANAVRSAGPNSVLTAELLQKLVSGVGKARAIERLRQLEKRTGPLPAIDALCAQLEENLRMSCPRCSAELRRPQMIQHLWDEHRLVLDGRRVREPWAVIEDWLDDCRTRPDPELLRRCRVVAEKTDGEEGLARLGRMMLARGLADAEASRALLGEARAQHAARCPWCYALVPVPREAPPLALDTRPGRLSGGGYAVDVSERGLYTTLEVHTPDRLIHRGPEPRPRWTARGATLFLVGPLVLLALACAFFWPAGWGPPIAPVGPLLSVALGVYVMVRLTWRLRTPADRRLLPYAWSVLAPKLHAEKFVPEDSAFLAGLARRTRPGQGGRARQELLGELIRKTEQGVLSGEGSPWQLAALRRLQVEDAAAGGEDPVPLVAGQLARCFEGKLPLTFAQHLLEEWETDWWTKGSLARLRVLLCDRAFEAGFEVRNLLDAGQTAPALGAVLGAERPRALSALRLLWSLRPSRPWDRCGPAVTAFELAADAGRARLLAVHPDVLLYQEDGETLLAADGGAGRMAPAQVVLGVDGVWLQGVGFREPPRVVEVRGRPLGSELIMGESVFRSPADLEALARRMERWFRYAFHEFLPQLPKVETWQSPDRSAILRAWGAVPCPECHRHLLARVGEVGIALDEESK
jgi:hypothetical protein